MVITSVENEKIKRILKLQRKKYRDLTDTYYVETDHLVEEAYKAGIILELFVLEGELVSYELPCTFVSMDVMRKLSMMETPSHVIALCKKNPPSKIMGNRLLLLDEIQDPGNLGTMIRSAVAFGIDMIILSNDTVDLYNPKVLRSSQGMYCHIPILSMDSKEAISYMRDNDYLIYGTNVVNGVDVGTLGVEKKKKFCLVMGNEGNGLKKEIQNMCDQNLYISMDSKVESLNVAIACSILLYELRR